MISLRADATVAFRLLIAADLSLAAGCDRRPPEIPDLSQRTRWAPIFTKIYEADAIADPMKRCIEYPSPPNEEWPVAMVEALCRDVFTAAPQADAIKAFVDKRDWAGLKAHYDAYLARHYAGEYPESLLYRAFPRFSWRDEQEMADYTERWLKARPQDAYANHMRAEYLIWKAWDTRGGDFGRIAPARSFKTRVLAEEASRLLRRALDAEPRLLPAYERLIEADALSGRTDSIPRIVEAATKQSPSNFYVRRQAANFMQPVWGGTFADLDALAADAKPYLDRNPRLGLLFGKSTGQRAQVHARKKQYGNALKAARDALKHGPDDEILELAILASDDIGYETESLIYLSQIVRFNRAPSDPLIRRGWLWEQNNFYAWALRDYRAALKLTPQNADLRARIAKIGRLAEAAPTSQ